MSIKFKTVITTAGAAKLAAATTTSGQKVNITHMAVGDGNGNLPEPSPSQTALINEVWRGTLNKITQNSKAPNQVIAELVIPPEVGGFWMRELGLYDSAGTLIAVASMAESYKPLLTEGSGRAMTCRMIIIISDINAVSLSVDSTTIMATQDYVDDKLAEHEQSRRHPDASLTQKGFTQLSSATDSNSESVAATPKAIKTLNDTKAPLKSPALTGTPTAPTAAQGTNNTQIATTAYVRAAISALVGSSPEALDTLNELAAALGNDPNFATTMTNALAGKQPLDATLTALAGLATAANKLPYFTGKDTVALADLTSVGRNILAKTSVLAVIQYLGLRELGTSGEKIPLLSTANTWSERQTFNGGITGSLTGNADTATKLKTARKINNVSFDGSSDITLTASDVEALSLEDARKIIQPLPDVWIPFNDSLDMITGFAPGYKSITVGDDVITLPSEKVVSFTRASTATYIDKSGCFAEAAINEPRFEKDGLLIEGQRTNTFSYTNTPASWNYDTANLTITTGVDEYGFSYGLFGVKETSTTERATLISTGYTRVISVSANESVTLSCRVKKVSGDGIITLRPRISYVNDDGSSNTLTAGAYIDCETGDMLSYSGDEAVTYNIFRESNGWIRVEFTYKSPEAKNMYGRFEFGAHQRSIKSGDELMLTTPQFEKGLNASSFIITTDVGATRASDQVIIPIPFNWATPPISVLMEVNVNWDSEMPNLEGSARLLNISITGATTEVSDESYMYFGFTTRGQRLIITNGKGTKTEYKAYGNREKRKFVAGFKFTEDKQLQVVVDGVLGSTSPSLHTLQRYTAGNINIGGQSSSGNRHLFGHVKNLRIWHKALTDQQMAEVI
ncbi:phage tail-collar fiber domain-containing protein [Escherichia coli]|uniref:phage tail-collar fiber domain-containing protein n=1 Tax=Escherichia coli TaxID=562 RepID=UPI001080DDEF|nr:phage tail protein [Escherichia coli]TGH01676.1 phage tail protein [Escherichia coli]